MKTYTVQQFGVDLSGNEYDTPVWEGEAENCQDAIEKALIKLWPDNDFKREFMRMYMKATAFVCN